MSKLDVVKDIFGAVEQGDPARAGQYMTEDFQFSGPVPEPVEKQQYIGLLTAMRKASPDWSFNLSDIHEHGDLVHATIQITGTQTEELDLTPMGFPRVPATGKAISLPAEHPALTFTSDDKVSKIHVDVTEGGGVLAILRQIGAPLPG